jgi:OmcA/MtrC family decaheme c-type cytochrome
MVGEHARSRFVLALVAGLVAVACGSEDRDPKDAGASSGCTVVQGEDGSVTLTCSDGTTGTVRPPPAAGACTVARSSDTVTIECPGGSSVSFPVGQAPEPCSVARGDDGSVTLTCPNGAVTIPGPSSGDAGVPQASHVVIGPSQAACGACHDSKAARAHFTAMTVEVEGELQETCGTCHNESSIEPVSRVHARPELGPPGFKIEIVSASVDPDTRKVTARMNLTDSSGSPLSRADISFNFLLAKVPERTPVAYVGVAAPTPAPAPIAGPYESYLTRQVTQVDTPAFPLDGNPPRVTAQATTERDGTYTDVSAGVVDYTFRFTLPEDYDPQLTHMIGIYATRTVNGVRFVANAEHFFVPANTAAEPLVRTAVGNDSCNSCHNPLSFHGGARQDLQLCLGCHSQGSIDPESGNSIDFNVMIHRIHMGKDLPSVKAGTPYRIVGNGASVYDYSHIGFPQDIKNCQTCHNTSDDRWVQNGTREACTSCHDDIFEPNRHVGSISPQTTCGNGNCHSVGGGAPDAREAHLTALFDADAGVFDVEILSIDVPNADAAPSVRIRARTGTRATGPVTPVTQVDHLQTLNVFVNGPNERYAANGNTIVQISKASLVNLAADPDNPGQFTFSLPKSLRETVAGMGVPELDSYTMSLRAVYDPTPAEAGTDRLDMRRNPTRAFSAAEEVVARTQVVDTDKCNKCHADLSAHGGGTLARNVEQCVMCHTAHFDTRGRQGQNKVAGPTTSLRFSTMVHRIHAGGKAELPYIVYARSATPPNPVLDLSNIGFPGALQDCASCHVGNTYQLPLPPSTPPTETVILDADGKVVGG